MNETVRLILQETLRDLESVARTAETEAAHLHRKAELADTSVAEIKRRVADVRSALAEVTSEPCAPDA